MKQGYTKSWRKKYDSKTAKRGLLYVGALDWFVGNAAWRDTAELKRGQVAFGRQQLAEVWKVSEMTVRTIIKNLVGDGFLTIKTTNKKSIATICNYDSYQADEEVNQPPTNQQINQQINQQNNFVSDYGIDNCDAVKKPTNQQINQQINQQTPENDAEKKKYQKENIRNVIINNNNINTKKNSKEKSGLQSVGCGVVNFYPEQETGIAPLKEMTQADKSRMIRDIIAAYPRRISPTITASAITRAISRITETQGITQQQAAEYLLERVQLYARAVKLWDKDELRYIANPAEFFNRDQYLESEDLWFRGRIEMVDEVEYDGIDF